MDFVHKMFPVPSDTISAVFARLKTSGIYNAGRWKDFPPEKARVKEKVLCAPFIQAANAIREATESVVDGANNDLLGVAGWVDYHSQVSKASDPDAAPIRPDCLLGHNVSKFKGIAYASKTEQTAQDGRDTMSTRRKKEALQASVWWLQIICAIEMKRNDSQTGMDVVKQLIRYLRRILCEQLDRRFVFGMTLGPNRMTVWLHDRSGVLGTTESFNIHEDPCSFIRVIAAFSVLSMEQLGYDTQMILYASPTNIVPTYMLNDEAARHYLTTANTEKQWLIRTNGEEQYLTVKVLSVSRAYVVQSRASLVWAVVPFNGGKVSSTKVHVLKQSWQPEKTDSEHDMLTKVKNAAAKTEMNVAAKAKYSEKDFIGEVQLEEIISVGGVPDITGSLIRRHLDVRVSTSSSTVSKRPRDEDTESYLHVNVTDDDIISIVPSLNTSSPPISRIHTRLLLSTYGWPLECFKTLKEAVCGIRDAVGGHEYVYVNGLLHRDISPSNIILAWCDGDDGTTGLGTKGCLIDFDRGKYGKLNEPILQVPANFPALDPEDAAPPSHFARRYRQLSLPPIVANVQIASSEAVPPYYVDEYIIRAWTHFSKFAITGIGHEVDPSLLRWTKVWLSLLLDRI
ncbi:hypothetical protein BDN71DRAFT_1438822 [Pleurotus eryngii]|uniref:Fungal-type protein kinase domain-containing protein n=1 Tax=Pleurotus eryngii TaxID=5323 RepID=A0A9P6A8W3_PLEER|nr:hypothetical protein BDN71DRAFT_1438822 [Pleurotus eryngii]